MLPPGLEWREITLGMLSMIYGMIWEKNKRRIYIISLVLVGIYVARKAHYRRKQSILRNQLTRRRKWRTAQRDQQLQLLQQNEVFTSEKDAITRMSFVDLRDALRNKKLSVSEVMDAYLMKAGLIHKRTNCVTDIIDEAKGQSRQRDVESSTDKLLFGIPVSIKENYNVKNRHSNMGCSYLLDKIPNDDCAIVKMLKYHGAIPFVKTNVPQTLMSCETTNPIYGMTSNPHDSTRTCGGSSGGEGVLIASHGSVLGFGTDVGGSIRLPAHMNGICGIKPTLGRLSKQGVRSLTPGQTCVTGTVGPMGRDVDTLVFGMKAILHPKLKEFDHRISYLPFDDKIYTSTEPLHIGYYMYDGGFHATRPCERAVEEGVTILQHLGHKVTKWHFGDYGGRGYILAKKAFSADGGASFRKFLAHDAIDPNAFFIRYMDKLPHWLASVVHKWKHPQSILSEVIKAKEGLGSVENYFNLVEDVHEFQNEFVADWKENGFDVVICPAFSCPAGELKAFKHMETSGTYTALYNLLNFPAGVLPVTKVTNEDLEQSRDYPVSIDAAHKAVGESLIGSEGLPIGLQVVALPWQEELCLRVMKEVETAIKKREQ